MSAVKLRNVQVEYKLYQKPTGGLRYQRGGHILNALNHIDLNLSSGDHVGLLGKNGSGKSTLLRVMSGLLPPTRGSVQLDGTVFPALRPAQGMIAKAPCIDNIRLLGLFYGFRGERLKSYVDAVITIAELQQFLYFPVNHLSAGMRSRLQVATFSGVSPEILLMDEWIGAADEKVVAKNEGILRDLVASSEIFVLASHRRKLIKNFCNKAIVIDAGKILFQGSVEDAFDHLDH